MNRKVRHQFLEYVCGHLGTAVGGEFLKQVAIYLGNSNEPNDIDDVILFITRSSDNLSEALAECFDWSTSEQGHRFWKQIYELQKAFDEFDGEGCDCE